MWKFILCSFAFLGWGFYELSGGSEFEPPAPRARVASTLSTYDVPEQQVTQAASTALATPLAAATDEATAAIAATALAALETYTPEVTQPVSTQDTDVVTTSTEPALDIRQVDANRVNMRNGPSTSFQVLARLTRGADVQILQIPGDGWVKLRVLESGRVGWMAERLLTDKVN
ncbi:MAG: SH3 domain-containing protein [Planktomarina sp.]